MPDQLSVHRNPGRNRAVVPYLLVVQSNQFRDAAQSVIVPLVDAEAFGAPESEFGPRFVMEGREVALDPLQITNVPRRVLGPPVGSLEEQDDRVVRAMDILLSRAWR
jgi:toxin CcdB